MSQEIEKAEKKTFPILDAELGFTVGQVATILTDSGFFGKSLTPNQAITKIMIGKELGMNTMQSIMNINCFDGNISISANWRATAIKNTGVYDYRIKKHDATICTIAFYQHGEELGETSYTIEDARNAGLTGKNNWKSSPKNMLFARAISNGQRFYCPECIGGLTALDPDELEEIRKPEPTKTAGIAETLKTAASARKSDVIEGEYKITPEAPATLPTPETQAPVKPVKKIKESLPNEQVKPEAVDILTECNKIADTLPPDLLDDLSKQKFNMPYQAALKILKPAVILPWLQSLKIDNNMDDPFED